MTMMIVMTILLIMSLVMTGLLLTRKNDTSIFDNSFKSIERNQGNLEKTLRDEMSRNRDEFDRSARQDREEVTRNLSAFQKSIEQLTQRNEEKLEKIRDVVEQRLQVIQNDNSQKLEQMRLTVDEKLHATLEKRLGESFQLVSDRLEKVHQGLGEMQTLASGVGDLKKVLTNVKTRGTWGEVQLGNLLEQILTADQYEKNFVTKKGSRDPVEYVIKFPGRNDKPLYLPIDAKFPTQDYERLQEAQEKGDLVLVEDASKAIENRIKFEAKNIRDKYLEPPSTTDFGILFLPTEGLYAEVLRRPGLADQLRNEFKVLVTGPTTIAALLNSLQMGFRRLAVEKRASEVWTLLGTIKTEFGKFGEILDSTQKKLQEASNTIERASQKSRNIERKLKGVEGLTSNQEPVNELFYAESDEKESNV